MRVLVTGSNGYIGSVVAPELAAAGHDVTGLDTFFYEGCDFGPEFGGVETVRADIRDVGPVDLEPFDAIVHLAALSNDPLGDLNAHWTFDVNLDATISLARAAKKSGVRRFVFASSCSMYGASGLDELLDEEAPLKPLTPYAESKVRAEQALARLTDTDFAVVSMRNATVYGVSPRLRLDVVLNNLAAWAHTTGRVRLMSDGSSWRPLIHVRDLADATLAVLEAETAVIGGEAFNVGSDDQNYLIRDLAELLSELTGCEVEFAPDASPDPRSYRVSFAKLTREFPDLRPRWTARTGATELLAAFRKEELTTSSFEGRRYVRLRQLRHLLDSGLLNESLRWTG